MKTFIIVFAALTVTTAAFADAGGPIRNGSKCWAMADQRGYGFWDKCARGQRLSDINQRQGLRDTPQPETITSVTSGADGAGGGGGGGGGR